MSKYNPLIQPLIIDSFKADQYLSNEYFNKVLTNLSKLHTLHSKINRIDNVLQRIDNYEISDESFESMLISLEMDTCEVTKTTLSGVMQQHRAQLNKDRHTIHGRLLNTLETESYLNSITHKHQLLADKLSTVHMLAKKTDNYNLNGVINGYTVDTFNRYLNVCITLGQRLQHTYTCITVFSALDICTDYKTIIDALGLVVSDQNLISAKQDYRFTDTGVNLGWTPDALTKACNTIVSHPVTDITSTINEALTYRCDDTMLPQASITNMYNTLVLVKAYDDIMTQLKEQLIKML